MVRNGESEYEEKHLDDEQAEWDKICYDAWQNQLRYFEEFEDIC